MKREPFRPLAVELGHRIKEMRNHRNLLQRELGDKVDLSREQINNIERGYTEPRLEGLIAISRVLKVSVSYLLGLSKGPKINRKDLTRRFARNVSKSKKAIDGGKK